MRMRYIAAMAAVAASAMAAVLPARGALSEQDLALVAEVPSQARDLFQILPVEDAPAAIPALLGAIESSDKRRSQKSHLKAVMVTYMWMGMREAHDADVVGSILALACTQLSLQDLTIMTAALMLAAGPEGGAIYARMKGELDTQPASTKAAALAAAASAAEAPGIYVRPRTMETVLSISGRLLPSEPLRQPVLPVIITGGNPNRGGSGGGKSLVPTLPPPPPPRPYPGQR
jgi:hypothetical protein